MSRLGIGHVPTNIEISSLPCTDSMGIDNKSLADKIVIPSVFIGQDDAEMIIDSFLFNKGYVLFVKTVFCVVVTCI